MKTTTLEIQSCIKFTIRKQLQMVYLQNLYRAKLSFAFPSQ